MRQRVGNRALKQSLRLACERRVRREVVVEPLQRVVEAGNLCVPLERRRVVPRLLALRDRQRPVEQIADVREDLRRRLWRVADGEGCEARRRVAHGFTAAIGDRGQRVTKERAFVIH